MKTRDKLLLACAAIAAGILLWLIWVEYQVSTVRA